MKRVAVVVSSVLFFKNPVSCEPARQPVMCCPGRQLLLRVPAGMARPWCPVLRGLLCWPYLFLTSSHLAVETPSAAFLCDAPLCLARAAAQHTSPRHFC